MLRELRHGYSFSIDAICQALLVSAQEIPSSRQLASRGLPVAS